jgi:hypothetical protein
MPALSQNIETFKALCALMVEVGSLVGAACDQLVGTDSAASKSVEELVRQSQASKARLLHYVSSHEDGSQAHS